MVQAAASFRVRLYRSQYLFYFVPQQNLTVQLAWLGEAKIKAKIPSKFRGLLPDCQIVPTFHVLFTHPTGFLQTWSSWTPRGYKSSFIFNSPAAPAIHPEDGAENRETSQIHFCSDIILTHTRCIDRNNNWETPSQDILSQLVQVSLNWTIKVFSDCIQINVFTANAFILGEGIQYTICQVDHCSCLLML